MMCCVLAAVVERREHGSVQNFAVAFQQAVLPFRGCHADARSTRASDGKYIPRTYSEIKAAEDNGSGPVASRLLQGVFEFLVPGWDKSMAGTSTRGQRTERSQTAEYVRLRTEASSCCKDIVRTTFPDAREQAQLIKEVGVYHNCLVVCVPPSLSSESKPCS
jgi:hypothetical protein